MRLLLYSHDGVGLGHIRRHLAISAALAQAAPETHILLATSVDEVSLLGLPPNVDTLKLPALRKMANNQYASRRLNLPASEIRALRSSLLLAAVKSFKPAVVLVDKHPFGAGGELQEALAQAKASGARLVLGLRDILDEASAVLNEWVPDRMQQRINALYNLILVYGERSVFDVASQYQFPVSLSNRTQYCGYVLNPSARSGLGDQDGLPALVPGLHPTVLGTTGGGEDGFELLETFIAASAGAAWKAIVVAGPMLGQEKMMRLQTMATEHEVIFHTFVPGLSDWFTSVDGLVCMGGYNTLVEAVSQGIPTTCVPRAQPRSEQLLRAQAFEQWRLLLTIHPDELSVARLRSNISSILPWSRAELRARACRALSFDGAQKAAGFLLELARSVRRTSAGQLVPSFA